MITACTNAANKNATGADTSSEKLTGENVTGENTSAENADMTPLPADGIRNMEIELTDDAIPEHIITRMYEITGEEPGGRGSEMLVSQGACGVQVTVLDGATGEVLYDRKFSIDQESQGQLALVSDGENWYMMENNCNEQNGEGIYHGVVFSWEAGEKKIIDEFDADFVTSKEVALQWVQEGKKIISRDDVLPQYQQKIENWYENSELLVACDAANSDYNEQNAFLGTDKRLWQYTLEDFFRSIWKRPVKKYDAGTFENVMGKDGICIYETEVFMTICYYYAEENDELIADTWGEDFIADVDENGVTELVSNVVFGDGAQAALIYYLDENNNIQRGFADDLLDEEYDNNGIGSEYAKYIPEENVVEIFYYIDAIQDFKSKRYEIDFSKIDFQIYKRRAK